MCAVTLSGAIEATLPCASAPLVTYDARKDAFALQVSASGAAQVSVAVSWPGKARTGHFASSDGGALGGISVTTSGPAADSAITGYWAAVTGGSAARRRLTTSERRASTLESAARKRGARMALPPISKTAPSSIPQPAARR